ncbi:lysis system i-spanin subunit Rz [Xanthomonas sp. NCPPB 1068]|uniref:lysis system i-spanin subunit Rz n=1 Tax=Xanthomonas sp. NCPPB 1068 TaxID=487525 RepID=UPI0035569368
MNRAAIALIVALLWSGAMFGAGWAWRGDRAEGATSEQKAGDALGALAGEQAARSTEHKQAEALADIGAKHEEDRQAAQAVPDAVMADLRDGNLKLRNDLATCNTDKLSQAAAGAVERDAPAQLRAEVAGAAIRIVVDADDQLRACQAVVRAWQAGS